ncbi:PRTRC genetic system protein E [Silvibacterium bohemicum]|uniref:PRTRC genetic system protein E n=1 Tax=Silvibacterium bohemicum TaxID=1577686 RepID=A0A841K0W4_9BACT|nr:PRTRC system protein E [Silvibacterium bohemicum]MBB6144298.1 PRTRC genetic system protein E [Silvibacterium bohemicum]
MFQELAPVLRHRAILMTITPTKDDQIRVNVLPRKLKDDENNALTTPLTVTGTVEELDADLGRTLVEFVGAHLQLKNTLAQAKADMDAAAKTAQAEARAKTKTPVNKATNSVTVTKPSQQTSKPPEPVQPPRPKTASLFDMSVAESQAPEPAAETNVPQTSVAEEDDILSEINEDNHEGEQLDQAA